MAQPAPMSLQSESLFAQIIPTPGVITVKAVGPQISTREVPIITELVEAAIAEKGAGLEFLVLDLSQVNFMNSMALGMCVVFRNRAAQVAKNAKVIISGMNEELTGLFKMVKFDKLFTIVKDDAALQKALGK